MTFVTRAITKLHVESSFLSLRVIGRLCIDIDIDIDRFR